MNSAVKRRDKLCEIYDALWATDKLLLISLVGGNKDLFEFDIGYKKHLKIICNQYKQKTGSDLFEDIDVTKLLGFNFDGK